MRKHEHGNAACFVLDRIGLLKCIQVHLYVVADAVSRQPHVAVLPFLQVRQAIARVTQVAALVYRGGPRGPNAQRLAYPLGGLSDVVPAQAHAQRKS